MAEAIDACWLEQIEADVPTVNQWLSAREESRLATMRFNKRRTEWRLGRWTAKCAVASYLNLPLDISSLRDIEIQAAPSGAPEVCLFNQDTAVSLSISHRAGKALCVVGLSRATLGCDLELVESRDQSFVADFFTTNEQKLINRSATDERPMLATLLWSAKESALKALQVGLRLDTTSIEVRPADVPWKAAEYSREDVCTDWSPLSLRVAGEHILRGCWRCADNMVRTVVLGPLQRQRWS